MIRIAMIVFWACVLVIALIVMARAFDARQYEGVAPIAWDRVAGEWEQYRLTEPQMNWFRSVRSKQGVPCCDISDGHPTEMKRREDDIYIPDPFHVGGPWLLVPKETMTVPPNNPIGVATVWYVVYIDQNGRQIHIRCFVPESET